MDSRSTQLAHALESRGWVRESESSPLHARLTAGALAALDSVPAPWKLGVVLPLGAAAAAGVAYLTSKNPSAAPANVAVVFRILLIASLIATGLYTLTTNIQKRLGCLLLAAGFFCSLWLLNGSRDALPFTIGVVLSGVGPTLFAYLMLAHPTGHVRSGERRFLLLAGGLLATLWVLAIAMTRQPPLKAPLLQCAPHCPTNVISFGSQTSAVMIVKVAIVLAWLALVCGTSLLLTRRLRHASDPMSRSLTPVWSASIAGSSLLVAYLLSLWAGFGATPTIGAAYVVVYVVTPAAILTGLTRERLFIAHGLAEFVSQLARDPRADPEALMATALHDSSLRIAYRRPGNGNYVDASGSPIEELPPDRAISLIERDHRPLAAVIFDPDLADQERFVKAAGAAAVIRLERVQLEANLKTSTADLAASRIRLMETAHAERRRLERDLHDGVQQELVGLRLKLEVVAETLQSDPVGGQRALALLGEQMDDVLQSLRSLASGIYPSLLGERGLGDALKSATRNSPVPATVRAAGIGRYKEEIEIAVYFCCLEALQNVAKHAGSGATAALTLSQEPGQLRFEVRDSGNGFDPDGALPGNGLTNMRDRIQAVGGTLEISSRTRRGTSVSGSVPVSCDESGRLRGV